MQVYAAAYERRGEAEVLLRAHPARSPGNPRQEGLEFSKGLHRFGKPPFFYPAKLFFFWDFFILFYNLDLSNSYPFLIIQFFLM